MILALSVMGWIVAVVGWVLVGCFFAWLLGYCFHQMAKGLNEDE